MSRRRTMDGPEQPRFWKALFSVLSYPFRWVHWKIVGRRRTIRRMKELAGAARLPVAEVADTLQRIRQEEIRLANHRANLNIPPPPPRPDFEN